MKLNNQGQSPKKNLKPSTFSPQQEDSEAYINQLPFVIKQINDNWYICKPDDSIPFYQIQFCCDYYGLEKQYILDNLKKQQFEEFQWLSVNDYFSQIYSEPDKKRIVYTEINQYKNKSSIAKYMMAIFDQNQGSIQTIIQQQENSISLIYESLQKIMEYHFETAVDLIVKAFQMQGFSSTHQNLSINPKLTAFSLLLGLFDCFPERYDEILQYLLKDTLFPGSNIVDLILSYLNQENDLNEDQEEEDIENEQILQQNTQRKNLSLEPRIQIVNQILKRLNEVQSKKQSQYSEYLILEFNLFIKKIKQNNQTQTYQVVELPLNLSKEFDRQQCSQIIWLKLKNKISYKEQLTQRELDEWRRIAYSEFYTDALVQLASYSLDQQDVTNSKKCFKILYCLGHDKFINQLYQLEIFERNYVDAYTIAESSENAFEKQALCLYKNGNWQQSIKLISENLLNHTRDNLTNLHCLWQLQSNLKQKGPNYSNMASCLLANEIFKTQFADQNQTLKYYLLCKQILGGYFFEKDLKNVRQILELIQSQIRVTNQQDQITRLFIDRKMQKVPQLKLKKNKESPIQSAIKFSQNILKILNIDRKYIKQRCMQQKELLQEHLNESLQHEEKKLLQFLIQLAKQLIFEDESLYKEKQLGFNEDKIIRKSLKNAQLLNDYRSPTSMYVLDFVKQGFTSKEVNNNNYQDIIKEVRIILEKNQNLEEGQSNNGLNSDLFQYQIDQNNGIKFQGNLVGSCIPYIASSQITLLENNIGYFNFNSQLFSVFALTESSDTITKFDNLLKQPSPYCLNAYSYCIIGEFINLLCEPFEDQLFEFLKLKQIDNKNSFYDQQQKSVKQKQDKELQQSQEVLKSLRESELKYSSEIEKIQKEKKDFFITNQVFLNDQNNPTNEQNKAQNIPNNEENNNAQNENNNKGEIDNLVEMKSELDGNENENRKNELDEKIEERQPKRKQKFELEETILITELIAICASLHMVGLSGFFALYADSLFFINERGELKIPNLVAMQFQKDKMVSKFSLAPELFLHSIKEENGTKADIWAIGAILYRIFWGKDFIDQNQDIVEQLMRFKKLNEIDRILNLNQEEHLFFDLNNPHNNEVKILIHDIIKKCLQFDNDSRPSSIELLLQVHQFFKKVISPEGIFSLYGRVPVVSYLYSLDNVIFQKENKKEQEDLQKEKESKQDIYLISGGNSLINLKNGVFIYITSHNTVLVVYNPLFKNKNINDQNLINVITGQGFLQLISNGRQLTGQFSQYGQISKVQMLDRFLKRKIKLTFDEQNTPKGSETEEKLIEDPYNKSGFLEDQQYLKKFISIIKESQNGKQFIDFYGNLVNCNFDEFGNEMFDQNEDPFILIDSMKNFVIYKNKAFILDFQTLSYSVFYEIMNEDEGQTQTFFQILTKLKNSHLVKQHLLEGMKYIGSLNHWEQDEGQLFFQFSNTMRIKGKYTNLQEPYYTKICYSNNDFYEGTIIDGKYNGMGVYGNKNAKIFDGYYEDDQFKEGTIFYHGIDTPYIKYVGQVKFNVENQIYIKEGQGCLFSKNEDFYEGEFLNDKFHGQGLLKYQQNRLGYYQGMFQEGVREGYGILKDKNGNVYEGNFGKNKKEGKGREQYVNGNVYVGDFLNNKRDGEGILDYSNQDILQYEGQFKEGKRHGEGIERYRDGKKYQVKYYKDQEMRRQFIGVDKKTEEIVKIQQRLPFKTYSFI